MFAERCNGCRVHDGITSQASEHDELVNPCMGNTIGSLTKTYTVTADSPTAVFLNIDAAGSINGVQETETLTYSVASDVR